MTLQALVRFTMGLVFLAAMMMLAGCAAPEPQRVEVFRAPPAALLTCQDSPVVPDAETQAEVARYVVRLHAAGADCRSKLGAVKKWSESQENITENH